MTDWRLLDYIIQITDYLIQIYLARTQQTSIQAYIILYIIT